MPQLVESIMKGPVILNLHTVKRKREVGVLPFRIRGVSG